MKVTLFSTHCPRCTVLQSKLDDKSIEYELVTDMDIMEMRGIMSVPTLEVDGELMKYPKALAWVDRTEEVSGTQGECVECQFD